MYNLRNFITRIGLSAFVLATVMVLPIPFSKAEEPRFGIDAIITGATTGSDTGYPLPRFVSIKAARAFMRVGPSFDHPIEWIYVKPGLPVEIIQEFDVWRQIRDFEGQIGWVHKSLLQGKRNILIAPWQQGEYFSLYSEPQSDSRVVAQVQSRVITAVRNCIAGWCYVQGHGYRGWMARSDLWGVYPGEILE